MAAFSSLALALAIIVHTANSLLSGNCTAVIKGCAVTLVQHLDITDSNGVTSVSPTLIPPLNPLGTPSCVTTTISNLEPNTLLEFHVLHAYVGTQPNFIATIELNCDCNSGRVYYSTGPLNGFPYGPWSVFNPLPSMVYTMQYTLQSAITTTMFPLFDYTNIDPNALWVSNGQQFDQIDFIFNFTNISCEPPVPSPTVERESNCTAKICAHGDNTISLDVSYDDGYTWNMGVASETNWQNTLNYNVNPVDLDTILRFTVVDAGGVGGFLATVQLCGDNGYVWSFFTDQVNIYYDVISDTPNNDELIDVFNPFGTGPWNGYVNSNTVQCMNNDADWIWNNHIGNTMVFELNFGHHPDILKKLQCIEDTISTECCQYTIEDFVDTCYCGVQQPTTCCDPVLAGPCPEGCACCPDGTWVPSIGDATTYYCGGVQCIEDATSNCGGTICDPAPAVAPATAPHFVVIDIKDKSTQSNGQSVGANMMNDGFSDNNSLYAQMTEIKYMMYGIWIIMFAQFIVFLIVNIKSFCKQKNETYKSINQSDQDL